MRYDGHFRLAHELKQHLHDLLGWPGPMTHRQFETWIAWQDAEWNKPDRHDHYAMQVALWVSRSVTKHSSNLNRFRIPFKKMQQGMLAKTKALKESTNTGSIAASMASGMMGGSFTLRKVDKNGNILSEVEVKPLSQKPPNKSTPSSDKASLVELMKARQSRRRNT